MIFQRPVPIEDGPILENFLEDGNVRVFNSDRQFELCLSRKDIEYIDYDFAQALKVLGESFILGVPPLYFPEMSVVRANAEAGWRPLQFGIIMPESTVSGQIRLAFRRYGESWSDSFIYFGNKQSLDNFRLMLGHMKHMAVNCKMLRPGSKSTQPASIQLAEAEVTASNSWVDELLRECWKNDGAD